MGALLLLLSGLAWLPLQLGLPQRETCAKPFELIAFAFFSPSLAACRPYYTRLYAITATGYAQSTLIRFQLFFQARQIATLSSRQRQPTRPSTRQRTQLQQQP